MNQDLTEIIKTLMNQDCDEKDIAIAILSLKERWPHLTETEKIEIEATAFSIYSLGYDFDPNTESFPDCLYIIDDEDYEDENTLEKNENYLTTSYSYESHNESAIQEEKGLKKFFKRFKRNN